MRKEYEFVYFESTVVQIPIYHPANEARQRYSAQQEQLGRTLWRFARGCAARLAVTASVT